MDLLRFAVGGTERPSHVAAIDPFGISAWEIGAGPMPMPVMGTTEGEAAVQGLAERFPRLAKVIKGYYSRAEQATLKIPAAGVAPGKATAIMQGAGVSAEELAHRGIPSFVAGQQKITPAALAQHLEEHPLPQVQIKTLGLERPRGNYTVVQEGPNVSIVAPSGDVKWSNEGKVVAPDQLEELIATWHNKPAPPEIEAPTKHARWQVPGGADYQETLFTLPRKRRCVWGGGEAYEAQYGPNYRQEPAREIRVDALAWTVHSRRRSPHMTVLNILVHTRSNTRRWGPGG